MAATPTASLLRMQELTPDQLVEQVSAQVAQERDLPVEAVRTVARQQMACFADVSVQTFLPVLLARQVRGALSA